MQFTPYIPSPASDGSADPLGFLRPGANLADLLYRQFTVLSNHPGYLGFLCYAFKHLEENDRLTNVRSREFREAFRQIEILWGLISLHNAGKKGPSILNINRLRKVNLEDGFDFSPKNKRRRLYENISYGTLGHYYGPAVQWGLVDERTEKLTDDGVRLAEAWNARGGRKFTKITKQWRKLQVHDGSFMDECSSYALNLDAGLEEAKAWRELIDKVCRDPVIAPLWQDQPDDGIMDLALREESYPGFFTSLAEKYRGRENGSLSLRLHLCHHFEMIASIMQVIFEWEYISKLSPESSLPDSVPWKNVVVGALEEPARKFLENRDKTAVLPYWRFADELACCRDYGAVARFALQSHALNQKRKGAAPFMDEERILMQNRYEYGALSKFTEALGLNPTPESFLNAAVWRHRRNWYFQNGRLWLEYAGERHA